MAIKEETTEDTIKGRIFCPTGTYGIWEDEWEETGNGEYFIQVPSEDPEREEVFIAITLNVDSEEKIVDYDVDAVAEGPRQNSISIKNSDLVQARKIIMASSEED